MSDPNTRGPVTLTSTFFDRGSLAGFSGYGRVAAAQLEIAGPAADVASGAGGNIILGFEQRSVDDPADGLYALTSFTCRLFDGTTLLGSSVATVGRVTTPAGPESYATCTAGYPTPQYYTLDPIGDQRGIVIPNVVHVGHTYTFTIDAM